MNTTITRKASPHAFAAVGDANALRLAHRHRISIAAADWFGRTPLHHAAVIDHPGTRECIGVLLRRGANPEARDRSGRTPEDWARESGNEGALHLFDLWRKTSTERRAHLRAQAGFTIIEILLCLAAVSIVTASLYALFFAGTDAAALVKAQADTASLGEAAMSAYMTRASFAGLTTQSAIAEGWIPDELRDASGMPANAWGQPISLAAVDLNGAGDAKGARIEQGVPAPEACIRFVAGVAPGFDAVSVNGHDLTPANAQDASALVGPCGDADGMAYVVLVRRRM